MDVRIRMYRQGLGDCFLLTFPKVGGGLFHMLVDCGVLTGSPKGSARLEQVAQNIKDVTNNHVDLLVITHEHWDHLSGFHYKGSSNILKKLEIDRIWFSWMEGRGEVLGAERKKNSMLLVKRAAEHALQQMAPQSDPGIWSGVRDLLTQVGVEVGLEETSELSGNLRKARDFIRDEVMRNGDHLEPEFLQPGGPP